MKTPRGYYLICDPSTGKVVRKSHDSARLTEQHLVSLRIDKETWKSFRAGDLVEALHLPISAANTWMRALGVPI